MITCLARSTRSTHTHDDISIPSLPRLEKCICIPGGGWGFGSLRSMGCRKHDLYLGMHCIVRPLLQRLHRGGNRFLGHGAVKAIIWLMTVPLNAYSGRIWIVVFQAHCKADIASPSPAIVGHRPCLSLPLFNKNHMFRW